MNVILEGLEGWLVARSIGDRTFAFACNHALVAFAESPWRREFIEGSQRFSLDVGGDVPARTAAIHEMPGPEFGGPACPECGSTFLIPRFPNRDEEHLCVCARGWIVRDGIVTGPDARSRAKASGLPAGFGAVDPWLGDIAKWTPERCAQLADIVEKSPGQGDWREFLLQSVDAIDHLGWEGGEDRGRIRSAP